MNSYNIYKTYKHYFESFQKKIIYLSSLIEVKLKLNNVLSEVKISVIDTENEVSGTLWLMKKVLDKKVEQSTTSYYLDQELSSETYDFAYRDGNKLFVVHYTNNGENYFITEESLDQIDKALRWFIFVNPTIV